MAEEIVADGEIEFTDKDSVSKDEKSLPVNEKGPEQPWQQSEGGKEQPEKKFDEILSKVTAAGAGVVTPVDEDISQDSKGVRETIDEEGKIQKLLDLASTKGVIYAVKVARSLGDYYALDRMHDELADKLYEGLLERGLINKE